MIFDLIIQMKLKKFPKVLRSRDHVMIDSTTMCCVPNDTGSDIIRNVFGNDDDDDDILNSK